MNQRLRRIFFLAVTFTFAGISMAQGQSFSGKIGSAIQNAGSHAANNFGGQYSNGNQNQWQSAIQGIGQQIGNHWHGGTGGYWPPHCTNPPIILPPPPQHHYYYVVYYYCQHRGWQKYGTYHSNASADYAMTSLQQQGYRAYRQRLQR